MRLYAKKYNNKKSRFARASARFSALALNGNALNCNEKLNVSVDSCSTLASLLPLLALSTPVGFGLRPIVPLTKQYSIVLFGRVKLRYIPIFYPSPTARLNRLPTHISLALT